MSESLKQAELDADELRDWIQEQRWYASKSRSVSGIEVAERLVLSERPRLTLTLVQTQFATGTHELYQLLVGDRTFDLLEDPRRVFELIRRMNSDDELETADGRFAFFHTNALPLLAEDGNAHPVGVEQSNSSAVFDERLVLKVFRKLEPGINPELEMLRFLTLRGFEQIAPLYGWYDYDGQALAATLGVAQQFLPDAVGGWELVLERIRSEPEWLLEQLGALGAVTARMHSVLASDNSDPAFSPEEPSPEALSLLTATVDEDIEKIFVRLPDDERVAPIAGRGQDVRERLAIRAQLGTGGREIRTHGDYHLGQTLHRVGGPGSWVIIDFEGEPARALPERRTKRSPLRDVAGMLRSFAYATSALEIRGGAAAPGEFEERARERFLERYLAEVDSTLLPVGQAAILNLLAVYELEKAIYELQYELDNRPDWVPIPVAGIRRLLESE